jgi:hypothetical protein
VWSNDPAEASRLELPPSRSPRSIPPTNLILRASHRVPAGLRLVGQGWIARDRAQPQSDAAEVPSASSHPCAHSET